MHKFSITLFLVALFLSCSNNVSDKAAFNKTSVYHDVEGMLAYALYDMQIKQHYIAIHELSNGSIIKYPLNSDVPTGIDIQPDCKAIVCEYRPTPNQPDIIAKLTFSDSSWTILLSDSIISYHYPRFSPDGSKLLFNEYKDDSSTISIMDLSIKSITKIVTPGNKSTHASWHPSGKSFVFSSSKNQHGRKENTICIYDLSTQTINNIVYNDNQELTYPVFSPDGNNILFVEMSGGSSGQISSKLVAYNIQTRQLVDIYKRGSPVSSCWVGNDSLVAFGEIRYTENSFQLYLYNYLTRSQKQISPDGYRAFSPSWRTVLKSDVVSY